MKLIDRYIYTATRHLNEKERIELEEEIRETINDMLPDDYTDDDVRKVLYKLGNPTLLAEKYQDKQRYLIGPYLYNNYLYVLKLVMIIILSIAPVASFITIIAETKPANNTDFIVQFITQILLFSIQSAFQVFAWVTIIFAVMDRVKSPSMRWPFTGKEWTVEDLTEAPLTKKNKIGKSEPVSSIIFTMIFIVVICLFPNYLGWYSFGDNVWNINPLFNTEVLSRYIPLLLFLALLGIITAIVKLIYQRWTQGLAILNTIYNLVSIGVISSFLLSKNLFNNEFLQALATGVNSDLKDVMEVWQWGSIGIVFLIIVVTGIWDSIQGFRKLR